MLLFLTFSVLVANPKKQLYTANPARGLLNREKRTKDKLWRVIFCISPLPFCCLRPSLTAAERVLDSKTSRRGGKEKEWTDCVQSVIRAFGIAGEGLERDGVKG